MVDIKLHGRNKGPSTNGQNTIITNHPKFFDNSFIGFNSHTIHPFKVYNSMDLSIFTEVCNYHHYVILEHFITPRRKSISISSHFPFHLLQPLALLIYLLSLWICLFCRIEPYSFVSGFLHLTCFQILPMLSIN